MNDTLLDMVVKAIQNTPEKYYKADDVVMYERIFCYEFYHQFRCLMSPEMEEKYILSGETYKHLMTDLSIVFDVDASKEDKCSPDFVLHGGLKDIHAENQLIAMEVKRKDAVSKTNLEYDITKLIHLMEKEQLQFQIGLFISIGMDREELEGELRGCKDLLENCSCQERLYFIATEDIPKPKSNSCSSPAKDVPPKTDFSKYYFSAAEFLGESLNCGSKD